MRCYGYFGPTLLDDGSITGELRVKPAVEVGRLHANMGEGHFDFRAVFGAVGDGVDEEEAFRVTVALSHIRQVHFLTVVQILGNGDKLLAGGLGQIDERVDTRPRALPVQLSFMLASLRAQDEGLLRADNMQ